MNNSMTIVVGLMAGAVAVIILLIGLRTNILREKGSDSSPYSFSKFQLWFWMIVILPTIILYSYCNDSETSLEINTTCLVLLGVSGAITLSASGIRTMKEEAKKKAEANPGQVSILRELKLKPEQDSEGIWRDILRSDMNQMSLVRLQQLFFNVIFAVVFIYDFFCKFHQCELPDFNEQAFLLMGVSGGTYVIGRSQNL